MKLIFATQNPSKVKEVKQLLADLDIDLLSAAEVGISKEAVEDGETFTDNSLKKAKFVSRLINEWTIAEDAGICIKALNGAPGVHSARWAGLGANEAAIVKHTLQKLENVPAEKRQAWFECCVTLISPTGKHWFFIGKRNGTIAFKPTGQGRKKFPYDLIFMPEGFQKTYAEMTDGQKNSLSHRGLAFAQLKKFLKEKSHELVA